MHTDRLSLSSMLTNNAGVVRTKETIQNALPVKTPLNECIWIRWQGNHIILRTSATKEVPLISKGRLRCLRSHRSGEAERGSPRARDRRILVQIGPILRVTSPFPYGYASGGRGRFVGLWNPGYFGIGWKGYQRTRCSYYIREKVPRNTGGMHAQQVDVRKRIHRDTTKATHGVPPQESSRFSETLHVRSRKCLRVDGRLLERPRILTVL